MFMFVWRSSPQLHAQLAKLANTWRTYLPAQTQAQIDQVIASTPSTSAPAHVAPAARATPPHAGSTTQGWQVQAAAPSAGMQQPMLDAAQAMQAPAAAQLLLLAQSGGGMQLLQQGGYAAAAQAHGSVAPAYTAAPYAAPQQQQQQALQYAQAAPMQAPAVASATSTSRPPVSSEDIMASLQKLFGASSSARGSDGGAGGAGAGSAAPAAAAQQSGKVLNSRSFSVTKVREHEQNKQGCMISRQWTARACVHALLVDLVCQIISLRGSSLWLLLRAGAGGPVCVRLQLMSRSLRSAWRVIPRFSRQRQDLCNIDESQSNIVARHDKQHVQSACHTPQRCKAGAWHFVHRSQGSCSTLLQLAAYFSSALCVWQLPGSAVNGPCSGGRRCGAPAVAIAVGKQQHQTFFFSTLRLCRSTTRAPLTRCYPPAP